MPVVVLPRVLLSVISLLILGAAVYLLWTWFDGYDVLFADGVIRRVHGPTWMLSLGVIAAAWSALGRSVVLMFVPAGKDEPREERVAGVMVGDAAGAQLHVEASGPAAAPVVVLTHGWGLNSTAWYYTKAALRDRFRLVTWDLPGLGRSKPFKDGKYSIDRFAAALGEVVASTGDGPVILVGHSIGGMTTQTFWRTCSPALRSRVAGIVLFDTTHENPIRTMWLSPLWRALRWPLIEPLCWLTIALSPLVWLSSWQSYFSGSAQLAMRLTGFGRYATRGQVDFTARLACKGSPGVQSKGNLAMFRWKVTPDLPAIPIPVLVLGGDKDIVTLPSASLTIAERCPVAELKIIEGAGHMGFMERASVYDAALIAFAERVFADHAAPREVRA